tara:strand:+ start:566 stop:2335 length:1770 start_codon:yes stop_codon:yes gene_type:complete
MCLTNYTKRLIASLTILTLTTLVSVNSLAETATSGNLLPNAGDGQSSFQNTTDNLAPDKVGSGSGFTIDSGIQAFAKELEAKGEGIVSDTGSLVGVSTTTQSGNSFTTTTDSLDGGVTLNSITEVQNCEWTSSSYRCGQASQGGGQRDTYTNTIKITDENGNLLAVTTFTRNNDAGYNSNTHTYTDTVTNTLPGSRNYEWEWKGTDGGNTNSTASIGPNLLGASLTATLLDINYSPISEETEEEIEFANEQLELSQETIEAAIEELQEINLTELTEIETFEFAPQLIEIEEIQELKIEEIEFKALFEVNFKSILKEENLIEEFGTALIEENLTEEEFFEEATNMIIEELKPMGMIKEETNVSTMTAPKEEIIEETPTEELKETKKEELKEEEPNAINEKPTNETVKTEKTMDTNEETTEQEGQESEVVSNESELAEDKETEGQEETASAGETLENETDVSVKDRKITTTDIDSIGKKVEKIIEKITAKLKRVDQQLAATSFILSKGMNELAPDLTAYKNKKLDGGSIPDGNLEFLQTINILEQQQIYKEASLNAYISNDPIAVQMNALARVSTRINTLQAEIAALKSLQ